MRRSRFCSPRSRSACCPSVRTCRPGCRLPCCAPTRRCGSSLSKRNPNKCIFLPAPARTTRRYCGDPCSPPPPACTPKPCRPRKPRTSICCDPCVRPRPVSSPRSYSRPFRPFSSLYSCTDPCRPKKCGPLDPCIPRLTDRCDPCRLSDLCCPSPCSPPSRYIAGKCNKSRRPRRRSSSRCRPRRSASVQSSSCGSSYCESSYSRRKCSPSLGCQVCNCAPCCCSTEKKCSTNKDTSKGPTSWFLKKSGKVGKNKSPTEPHFCPWEAEVTVTGTVRGHCTSTAVEVAKRLTGKFSSRGQRYTCKKDACAETSKCKNRPQRMTMGYLDDGTKLDFSRNKSEENAEEAYRDTKACAQGRTNNASTETAVSANMRRPCWKNFENKERKQTGREKMAFATAFIGGSSQDRKHEHIAKDERQRLSDHVLHKKHGSRFYQSTSHSSGHQQCKRYSRHRHRPFLEESDTDPSLYETASEAIRESGVMSFRCQNPCSLQEGQNSGYARSKSRRKPAEIYIDNCHQPLRDFSSNKKQVGRRQNYYQSSNNRDGWYAGADGEHDVIAFDVLNNDDCPNASDNDDIDIVNSHHFPPWKYTENRRARSSDRRYLSPISYSRRNSDSRARRTRRHHPRTVRNEKLTSHPSYEDLDADSGHSSEGDLGNGRSSYKNVVARTFDRPKWENGRESKHLHHRKKVTYGYAL